MIKDNYKHIEYQLLREFKYTAPLLKQLSRMVFHKATTEQYLYSELYLDLCESLFQKFDDEENVEMNFKKLLLKRCYKHLNESDEVTQTSLTAEDKEEVDTSTGSSTEEL